MEREAGREKVASLLNAHNSRPNIGRTYPVPSDCEIPWTIPRAAKRRGIEPTQGFMAQVRGSVKWVDDDSVRAKHRLIQWNVIMYAKLQTLHCHWHCFQTNWAYHFLHVVSIGIKIVTALKCIFKETMPKLSENFGNHISQDSHKNQYPGHLCNFGFTAPQCGDKCWSNLLLKCYIFLIGNTHRRYCYHLRDHPIHALVACLEPVTTCCCGSKIKRHQSHHHCG